VIRRLTAALAVGAALAAAAPVLAPPARAGQQQSAVVSAALQEISPWLEPGSPLRWRLVVANQGPQPLEDLSVRTFVGAPVRFRSQLQTLIDQPGAAGLGSWLDTFEMPGVVPAGGRVGVTSLPIPFPGRGSGLPGAVLPVNLQVRARTSAGQVTTTVSTFVVYVSEQVRNRLHAALLVPLHDRSHRDSRGDFVDSNLAVQLAATAPLGAMVEELARPDAARVTMMVDALLTEEANAMGGAFTVRTPAGEKKFAAGSPQSRTSQQFMANLRLAIRQHRPGTLAYADADLPALARSGLESEALAAILAGRQAIQAQTGVEPDSRLAWPVSGAIDAATLRPLARTSAETVVLDASRLSRPATDDATSNATVNLSAGAGQPRRALVPDQALAAALSDRRATVNPAQWAQRILAETAVMWLERPGGDRPLPRGILLAPQQHTWRPPPDFFRALARGLARAPWLELEHAADLAGRVPQGPGTAPRQLMPVTRAEEAQGLPPDFLRGVAGARARLVSFQRVVGTDYPPIGVYDRNLLIAESSDWRGNARQGRRRSFAKSVENGIQAFYRQVTVEKTRFTLTARQGPIPIRVTNASDQRLTLAIRVSSPKVDVPVAAQSFTVEPKRGITQTVQVSTKTTGTFPIRVDVLTPDGTFTVASAEMVLVSTAFSRVALALTGGTAGFLLLWWSRRLGRRHRPGGRRVRGRRPRGPGSGPEAALAAEAGGDAGAGGAGTGGTVGAAESGRPAATAAVAGPAATAGPAVAAATAEAWAGGPTVTGGAVRSGSGDAGAPAGPPTVPEPGPGPDPDAEPEEPSLARSTGIMVVGTLLSRVTGMLRVIVLVATLGVAESKLADTYNVANTTPNIIYELVLGGILSSIFVPLFVEVRRTRGREAAWHVARSVMTVTFVVLGLLALAAVLAAPWIIQLYIHGGDPVEEAEAQRVGGQLLAMFMPQVVFYGVGAVMTGLLNANRRFGVPMFAPILNNLVVIAVGVSFHLLVGGRVPQLGGVTTGQKLLLGLGTTAGVVAMTMVQWPFLRRMGFRYRWVWDVRDPAIRKMAALSAFTIGYVVVNQLRYLVTPVLAYGVKGGYTAYTTAFIFFQLPHGVFAVSVITALLPQMSEHAVARDWDAFRSAVSRGVRLTAAVLLPAAVGYLALAGPIVQLLLVHGVVEQGSDSQLLLTRVLVVFVLGLVSFSTFQLTLRAFYALQDTRTVFRLNLVAAVVNVVLDLLLFSLLPTPWKVPGLAAGHAISYTVGAVLLLVALSRRIGGIDAGRILAAVARMLAASLVMGAAAASAASGTDRLVGSGLVADLAVVVAGVLAGVATYAAAARVLRIQELDLLFEVVRRRRGRARA
jgi:murein biosynthesis integral membrane protein MurJ